MPRRSAHTSTRLRGSSHWSPWKHPPSSTPFVACRRRTKRRRISAAAAAAAATAAAGPPNHAPQSESLALVTVVKRRRCITVPPPHSQKSSCTMTVTAAAGQHVGHLCPVVLNSAAAMPHRRVACRCRTPRRRHTHRHGHTYRPGEGVPSAPATVFNHRRCNTWTPTHGNTSTCAMPVTAGARQHVERHPPVVLDAAPNRPRPAIQGLAPHQSRWRSGETWGATARSTPKKRPATATQLHQLSGHASRGGHQEVCPAPPPGGPRRCCREAAAVLLLPPWHEPPPLKEPPLPPSPHRRQRRCRDAAPTRPTPPPGRPRRGCRDDTSACRWPLWHPL